MLDENLSNVKEEKSEYLKIVENGTKYEATKTSSVFQSPDKNSYDSTDVSNSQKETLKNYVGNPKQSVHNTSIVKPPDFDNEQDDTKVAVIETIPQNFISAQKRILTSPEKARDAFGDNRQRKHACDQCGEGFSVEWYLRKHIESKHEGNGYQCENCKYKAQTKTHLKLH